MVGEHTRPACRAVAETFTAQNRPLTPNEMVT